MSTLGKILLASSIALVLIQPIVLLGVVTNPVIAAILSWSSYCVDAINIGYAIWQLSSKRKKGER